MDRYRGIEEQGFACVAEIVEPEYLKSELLGSATELVGKAAGVARPDNILAEKGTIRRIVGQLDQREINRGAVCHGGGQA